MGPEGEADGRLGNIRHDSPFTCGFYLYHRFICMPGESDRRMFSSVLLLLFVVVLFVCLFDCLFCFCFCFLFCLFAVVIVVFHVIRDDFHFLDW